MAKLNLADMLKAQQWERTKGELRAMVAMQGSYSTGDAPPNVEQEQTTRWLALDKRVELFIKDIEDNGLQE